MADGGTRIPRRPLVIVLALALSLAALVAAAVGYGMAAGHCEDDR